MAVVLHMTAEEGSRLWHGFAGQGGSVFSRGERVETRTLLCRGVEGQILSMSDIAIFRQWPGTNRLAINVGCVGKVRKLTANLRLQQELYQRKTRGRADR